MGFQRYLNRESKDRDLAEEIQSHLEHEADRNLARGLADAEARRQARLKFGNPLAVRQRVWIYRSLPIVDGIFRDLRDAWRSLRRTPGLTIVALLVIALGIGVNTAVFSVVNTVLLQPLPYPDPQSLMRLVLFTPQRTLDGASVPEFNLWRQQTGVLRDVAGYDTGGAGLNLTGGDHPIQVQGVHVTHDYFTLFGAPVIAGRTFTEAEDSPHGGNVVVLSYGLWKQRFGGDRKIVGRTVQIDNTPYLVVGIIGPRFVSDNPADLWIPYQFDLTTHDMAHYFSVAARLQPGVTIEQANAQLKVASDEFRRVMPNAIGPQNHYGVVTLKEATVGDTRTPLLILLCAVGLVLLIACANVANLLLAKASGRQREFATRAALGAGRWQIIRQLLAESLMLSLSGGLLGLLLGYTSVRLLLHVNDGDLPRVGENGLAVSLDMRVLLFTFGVSVLTGILFGLVPAVSASRTNLVSNLNESGTRTGTGFRSANFRSALVITEIALALVLVVGSTLLIRTYLKLQGVDPGFDTHNTLTMAMSISGGRFQTSDPVDQIIRQGTERIKAVPGVVEAAAGNGLPLQGAFGMPFDIVGRAKGNAAFTGGAGYYSVSANYFEALKIPLLRGRTFTERDNASAPGVIIINEALAKQYWPNGDPLRDRLQKAPGSGPPFAEPPRQIVGIVGNTRDNGLDHNPFPTMYIPLAQMPDGETALNSRVAPLWWVVRTNSEPHAVVAQVTSALREATGGLPVAHIRTMDEIDSLTVSRQRFNMLLLTVFGASGLLLAAVGIYGLMAFSVEQRTQELGIRMAMGAQTSHLRNMVLRQGMVLTVFGVAIGIGAAFWLTRFLASFLFGVEKWDPLAFLLTPLLLSVVALVATWIPAVRATRVDPMTALRFE
ncbi:ABC transporter permease [Terriglobus albidus]|uniref:ABC transporter permease n=1 Tax=Terriglobus albidus TaxID=1592106 RepID=UPI0021DF57BC|nr:ABC transporter permease [Terriglobus albidus]